eukprot:CAMPEP_0183741594 /NCGR_PEP_ID=MMETSP0737-20130205/62558_1 /TAXON_ID=385413 /ORGANISM="Thalassiosira miniscula, Strain CCMP1093" /LENGTH=61 /DNA_ID=CAMNT_0025976977 /DNA_START=68 /DNA_END=249 /DNA_ORIENTATION=+
MSKSQADSLKAAVTKTSLEQSVVEALRVENEFLRSQLASHIESSQKIQAGLEKVLSKAIAT